MADRYAELRAALDAELGAGERDEVLQRVAAD